MANHVGSIMYAAKYFYRDRAPKYNVQLITQLRAISTQLQKKGICILMYISVQARVYSFILKHKLN